MRSATEPATSATVMIANVIWYSMNSASGMVFAGRIDAVHGDASEEPAVERAEPGTVADEGQRIAEGDPEDARSSATAVRLCAIVASTFFLRTMPE